MTISRVCICIPTYNAQKTLASTISSLLQQTYPHFVLKIIDNASNDSTLKVARKFQDQDSRVVIRPFMEHISAEGNFNRCIEEADGEFTCIFHSDDIYDGSIIEEQLKTFDENPSLVAVAVHARLIDGNERLTGERFLPNELFNSQLSVLNFEKLFKLTLKYGNIITCPSVMAKTVTYKENIKLWNGKDFKTSADLDVWLRMSRCGEFGFLSKPLMSYRLSASSFSFRLAGKRLGPHDLFLVINHYMKNYKNKLSIDTTDLDFLKFLHFKDTLYRNINLLRKSLFQGMLPMSIDVKLLAKVFFVSSWHRKYVSIALIFLPLYLVWPKVKSHE